VEASGKLERVSLLSRFETAFVFSFPSKLESLRSTQSASDQNQEILLVDGFVHMVFWPRDISSPKFYISLVKDFLKILE
jgi:hypothetical protein